MDPDRLLHQLINEMTDDLVEAKNHLAECKKEERRLAKQVEIAERAVLEWDQRAMSAVRAGDDFVAKDALLRKRQHEEQAQELRAALGRQSLDVDRLKNALVGLNLRIEEAKIKRNGILLRAKRAHVEILPPELSDEAIASGASATENAARTEIDLLRLQRAMTKPERKPKKPLAKTRAGEATRGKASSRDRAKAAGQKRTKR